jgi:dipeptidyl aminopeptidase/acylaminoacyl peptidase
MKMRMRVSIVILLALFSACSRREPPVPTVTLHSVADFYKNVEYFGNSFSFDAKRILVSSNESGIFNAYAVPVSGGEPQQLTHSTTDSIFAQSYFPKDDRILYTSDRDGNHLTHVFVRNPDGSIRDLTPGQKLVASFLCWSHDDKSFFVLSNERDARFFDLYEYAADGYARTLVYRNEEGVDVSVISRDKHYVALGKSRKTNDSDIWLLNRQTGKRTRLTAHQGDVFNGAAAFSPDGKKLLYLSDEGGEFTSLRSYEIATGEKRTLLQLKWDILGAGYSRSGKYLVVSINEDAANVSRIYDPATLQELKLAGVPKGLVSDMQISRDDSVVAFYATDGSVPSDLYAGPINATPTRLTNALNPGIRSEDLVVPERLRFSSYDGLEIPGLLYKPHQATTSTKAPALVLVHGGPGGQAQVRYSAVTQALVNHGYVVFDINNRGSSGYGKTFNAMDDRKHGEADLGDVVASKRMLVSTGYIDPAKIGIVGGSYGGYMVLAALTLQPDAFKVGVDLYGISNWVRTLENTPPWWESFKQAIYAEMGDPKVDSERLRRISPLFNASKIRAPLMVLQGANDPNVLKVESDEMIAAAKKNGVPTEYIVFPDEGHGFVKKENEIRGYSAILDFLDKYLKGVPSK